MVPEGWRKTTLEAVCRKPISYGIVQTGEKGMGNIPCVRVVDLSKAELNSDDMITTTPEIHRAYRKTQLEQAEIMMALRGEIGLVRMVPKHLIGANLTRGIARISASTGIILPNFLFQQMTWDGFRSGLLQRVNGSALQEIPLGALRKVEVLLPPLAEQKRIAEVLGVWDRVIEVAGKQLDLARTQKRALMQTLLTPTRRFPGYERQPWKEVRLGDVAEIKIGGTPSRAEPAYWAQGDEGHTWLSIADLGPKMLNRSKETITDEGIRRSNVKLVPAGTVVMSFKLTIGKLGIAAVPLYTNEAICAITPNSDDSFEPRFLFHLLQVTDLLGDVDQAVKGKTLNKAKLSELVIKLPDISEQRYVAQFLDEQDELVDAHETQITRLQAEKKALMQQLLTGKKRI